MKDKKQENTFITILIRLGKAIGALVMVLGWLNFIIIMGFYHISGGSIYVTNDEYIHQKIRPNWDQWIDESSQQRTTLSKDEKPGFVLSVIVGHKSKYKTDSSDESIIVEE